MVQVSRPGRFVSSFYQGIYQISVQIIESNSGLPLPGIEIRGWFVVEISASRRLIGEVPGFGKHSFPYPPTLNAILTRIPIINDTAAIPRLITAISINLFPNGRSWATDV